MDVISSIFILAVVVEKLVDLFKTLVYALPFISDKFKPITLEMISLGLGILLAYQTQIDSLSLLGVEAQDPIVGMIITGLVIGKGSNFAHDFFQYVSLKHKSG